MKPFDIEEAKKGKSVCTRSKLDVRIVCYDAELYYHDGKRFPLVALVKESDGKETLAAYTIEGLLNHYESGDPLDLFIKD